MERLTAKIKRPDKEDLIVYTKGTYEDTIPAEMTKNDIRAVLKKLAAYEDAEEQGLPNRWIPCSEILPECCGYPVLLTVENGFNQRHVCNAFTNYMKEGKLLFLTNEKEYCEELISSKLSNAWKPIAWMPLPEPYSAEAEKPQTNADRIRSMTNEELLDFICSIETYEQGSAMTIEGGVAMCSVTEVEQWLKTESEE
mgnify:CR=1 FL=1